MAASETRRVASFNDLPRRTLSRVATFLGSTAAARDVRALACSCKLAGTAVQKLPSMVAKVDPPTAPAVFPDGSVRELEEDVLARLRRAGTAVQSLRLEGQASADLVLAALEACPRTERLELASEAPVTWGPAMESAGGKASAARLGTLLIDRTHQLYHLASFVEALPALTSLSVVGCPDLTQDDLEPMAACLGRLRQLTLSSCSGITDFALGAVARAASSRLEGVCLSSCANVTSMGVDSLVKAHPRLRSLDIGTCPRVTEDVCAKLAASGVLSSLYRLRLPASVGDAGVAALLGAAPAEARGTGASAASTGTAPAPLSGLDHLGLALSSVSDAALGSLLAAAPGLRVLDTQRCASLSFRVVDVLVSKGRALQRIDVRGQRRLRWDDAAKLVTGLPDLVLLVADEAVSGNAKLAEAAGPVSVRLRQSPGLTAD